ncbi:iron-sulfur cluster assembly scaffold protein [Spiroplasma endosymbiont of Crioceris asparagi]|uniref:iron-sulfur cluster assembly scaffold protein n=1 Tax=Spiroplasma endosymbiont of Crioceris asparagi TaxID=3066286 RepID=UPI0030CB2113
MSTWLMDNYTNPEYKKTLIGDNVFSKRYSAKSCNDDITLFFDIKNDVINDVGFDGEGCALSIACANSFCRLIKQQNVAEAKMLANKFLLAIENKKLTENLDNELANFEKNIITGKRKICLSIVPNIINTI